jgi:hypothetical protein
LVAPLITSPFLIHLYVKPAPEFAFKVTDPPEQNVTGPAEVIVAAGGVHIGNVFTGGDYLFFYILENT